MIAERIIPGRATGNSTNILCGNKASGAAAFLRNHRKKYPPTGSLNRHPRRLMQWEISETRHTLVPARPQLPTLALLPKGVRQSAHRWASLRETGLPAQPRPDFPGD